MRSISPALSASACRSLLYFLVTGLVVPGALAGSATFVPLGFLPGGNSSSAAAISADGSVIVGSASNGVTTVAVRWVNGVIESLGVLPSHPATSGAVSVSGDGSVIVGISGNFPNVQGFIWSSGVMTGIGYLDGYTVGSAAKDVSRDGEVVVGWSTNGGGFRGLRHAGGVNLPLPDMAGSSDDSAANAVSADGTIVAGRGRSPGYVYEACDWVGVTLIGGLGDLPGGSAWSEVEAMSGDGSVQVGFANSANQSGGQYGEAARWVDRGPAESLGDLPGGIFNGWALGVSDDGEVIVGYSHSAVGREAFIWDPVNGMRSLRSVLESAYEIDMTGWSLTTARRVSPDGRIIVGSGVNPAGQNEAWMITFGCVLPGDTDGDGDVDFGDLNTLLGLFNQSGSSLPADFDHDGDVDFADLNILLGRFNTPC